VIFSSTKNKEAAIRFYKFHNNPEAVDLFARGLWMPLQKVYYTDPEKKKLWLDNSVHPFNTQSTFTDYVVNYSMPLPSYYVRNYAQVLDVALRPAINRIWNHEATAAEAFAEAAKASETLLQGRWDK
jgi:multiple sugar transport system substrate-binding protein